MNYTNCLGVETVDSLTINDLDVLNNQFKIESNDVTGNDTIMFKQGNDSILNIYNNKVGIGVTNPSETFEVDGNIKGTIIKSESGSFNGLSNSNLNLSVNQLFIKPNNENILTVNADAVADQNIVVDGDMRIEENQNANTELKINNTTDGGSSEVGIKISTSGTTGEIKSYANSFSGGNNSEQANSFLIEGSNDLTLSGLNEINVFTNDTQRMVVDNYGSVGIGNTNPSRKLDITGDITHKNSYVYRTRGTNQSISSGGVISVDFTTDNIDFDSGTDYTLTSTNTITINTAGLYEVGFTIFFAGNVNGVREAWIEAGGTRYAHSIIAPASGGDTGITGNWKINLVANDTVVIRVYQSSGSPLDLQAARSIQMYLYRCGSNY